MTSIRIAMVCATALPHMGGVETHVDEVSRRLADRGHSVSILTTDTSRSLPRNEVIGGVCIERFPAWPKNRDYYLSPQLARALAPGRFDVVHIQGMHTLVAPLALLAIRNSNVPTVLTFHTGGSSSPLRRAMRGSQLRVLRPLIAGVDSLIAVCEYEIHHISSKLQLPRSKFDLIRNGSDPLPVDLERPSPYFGQPLILSIGRLEKYKGHHKVIGCMPELRRKNPDAHLVIVGSGPYESKLRSLAERLHVSDLVSFTSFGPEGRGALGALIRTSDVVTLMSDYEAHPVAVMEALALGAPAVVADTSGLSELGEQGMALTVSRTASPGTLASAILDTASKSLPDSRMSSLQSWDDCTDQTFAIYGRLVRCAS
jgi:glycosyltransferase involved in cell wall biosynthesis